MKSRKKIEIIKTITKIKEIWLSESKEIKTGVAIIVIGGILSMIVEPIRRFIIKIFS